MGITSAAGTGEIVLPSSPILWRMSLKRSSARSSLAMRFCKRASAFWKRSKALAWVLTQAGVYGQTMDEPLHDRYGQSILAWYKTLGKDTCFIRASPFDTSQQGTIFDAVPAGVELLFSSDAQWSVHAIVIGLAGGAGEELVVVVGVEPVAELTVGDDRGHRRLGGVSRHGR